MDSFDNEPELVILLRIMVCGIPLVVEGRLLCCVGLGRESYTIKQLVGYWCHDLEHTASWGRIDGLEGLIPCGFHLMCAC